jgi:hypothetical protein
VSKRVLTTTERAVLEKGLNFCIAPKKIPKFEIIKSIETATVRLAPEKPEEYRAKIKAAIDKCKRLRSNTTKEEEEAIQKLSKQKDIKIIKADEGNITVVMDMGGYDKKLEDLVYTDEYSRLQRDPTRAIERKVKMSLKRWEDDLGTNKYYLAPTYSKPPHLYGLPKVHKEVLPLRAIVSSIGSPCHNLARYLLNLIPPVSGKGLSHLNNSFEFIDCIKQIEQEEGDQLVSFDVVSLFTSVLRQEAVRELKTRLERDRKLIHRTTLGVDKIMELNDLCLDSTYFQLSDKFYEQRRGLDMGSPLSPVLADLYMEKMETNIKVQDT